MFVREPGRLRALALGLVLGAGLLVKPTLAVLALVVAAGAIITFVFAKVVGAQPKKPGEVELRVVAGDDVTNS